jgi:hypothetical protein
MNVWKNDLSWSEENARDPFWVDFYKKWFPDLVKIKIVTDLTLQKMGIDKIIYFPDKTKHVLIDEKVRRMKDSGDIMLEYISNDRSGSPGWIEKDTFTDYVVWAFWFDKHIYKLPLIELRLIWLEHKKEWLNKYPIQRAPNNGYDTLNCAVPIRVIKEELYKYGENI